MNKEQVIAEFKKTWIITAEMRMVLRPLWIINWIWPWNISKWANYVLQELKEVVLNNKLKKFDADADYHDLEYYIWGTEEDRLEADRGFFRRLFDDILKMNIVFYKEAYYLLLSYIAYRLVRRYGKQHFTYN